MKFRILAASFLCSLYSFSLLSDTDEPIPFHGEFYFARMAYSTYSPGRGSNYYYYNNRWENWLTDWPDADYHFLSGIRRLTSVQVSEDGVRLSLLDEELFDYPWLYAVEVGYWSLSDEEIDRLREYLSRGGFLIVDDFHGSYEWMGFLDSMEKVFPDRPIVEIPVEDEVMHVLYDLDKKIQIPGMQFLMSGLTYEEDGYVPYWRGIYDDQGRLMVAINFNMDLGDAWEHADWPAYPEQMTALAYRFGINYVIYAMTH